MGEIKDGVFSVGKGRDSSKTGGGRREASPNKHGLGTVSH